MWRFRKEIFDRVSVELEGVGVGGVIKRVEGIACILVSCDYLGLRKVVYGGLVYFVGFMGFS